MAAGWSGVSVSLIIVSFNGRSLLRDCLESLEAQIRRPDEVIVVDNGSSDQSVSMVRDEFPWVRLIEAGENLGFAAGNNLGIRAATGEIIILLNNDTIPAPGFVESILAPLDEDQDLSAVSGVMLFVNQPEIVATSGIQVFSNGLALDRDAGSPWRSMSGNRPVFGPSGGAMAIRRSALDDVDLFPEPFFLYLEDVDLAWRMRLRNHHTVSSPAAWVLHHYSASSIEGSAFKDYFLARNRFWVLLRCWPRSFWIRFGFEVVVYELGALIYAIATGRWGSVRGRIAGWQGVSRLSRVRQRIRHRTTSSEVDLLYWICSALSVRNYLSFRKRLSLLAGGGHSNEQSLNERSAGPDVHSR
ncbi:MAG: glycosyltransferase family 2 protein [Sphaerobacteraceae bacterium]|nr:MAG: glycosyltransferase family 2 protein [Sphaerobacteraceae bacterium]